MTKVFAGHFSIILETIAFFFVTVDLYGKERLLALRNRIQALEIDEVNRKFEHPIKHSSGLSALVHLFVLVPIALYVFFSIKYGAFLLVNCNRQGILYLVIYLLFIVVLSALIIWKYREVIGALKYITREVILFHVVKFLILTTKLFPVEGVMITIGAVLYIISRFIAYCTIVVQ